MDSSAIHGVGVAKSLSCPIASGSWRGTRQAPGHPLTEPFTTADYARCLAHFLDELGVVRAHVLGLSWGEILAQKFYRVYPQRLRCLVLSDTYAGWKGSLPEPVCRERLASCLRDAMAPSGALVAKMLPGIFSDGAPQDIQDEQATMMSEFHPVGFRLMSISSAETDTRDLLPRIQVPTLLLWGDVDRRSPVHVAEQLHAAIPGAELAIIPEAGHLSNMEQPEAFNVHVRRFCLSQDTE